MGPSIQDIANRIRALREDQGITMQEMADATGRSLREYIDQESGREDPSFTFLYKCAERLGVDVVQLMTGHSPHLARYSLVRAGEGVSVKRHTGYEYLHKAAHFKGKMAEPFVVTIPYDEGLLTGPIHLSYHPGQEIDYVISGHMRFAYEENIEELNPGDLVMYDSAGGHGIVALDGEPLVLLAVVIKGNTPVSGREHF